MYLQINIYIAYNIKQILKKILYVCAVIYRLAYTYPKEWQQILKGRFLKIKVMAAGDSFSS